MPLRLLDVAKCGVDQSFAGAAGRTGMSQAGKFQVSVMP